LNICLFLPSFLPEIGGLENAADNLSLKLNSLGHTVVVLAQRPGKSSGAVERPFPVVHYEKPRSTTWFPFGVGAALKNLHTQYKFDLICAYQAYMPGYIAVRFGLANNVPVVISSRGGDISERGRYLNRWISRRRIIWALLHADAVTAISEYLAERVSFLTANRVRAHVIYNGVDIPDAGSFSSQAPARFAHLQNKRFILTLGRLHPAKGLDLLLDAIYLVKNRNKTVPTLIIAGDGREKENLLRQMRQNKLEDRVVFAGCVSGADKTWLLANCAFLAQPSRSEGLGSAVLEAMSFGKPVLAAATGGLPEIVTNNKTGLLVEPDSVASLAEGLANMLNSNLENYGPQAKKAALEHSWDNVTNLHLDLYRNLIRSRRPDTKSKGP